MTTHTKTLYELFKALKKKVPYTPDCDQAHDLIDRGIELCQAVSGDESDAAIAFLKSRHSDIKSARVSGVEVESGWLRLRIPINQPLIQQIDWARTKGRKVEITIIHLNDKISVEEFDLNKHFQKKI